jgi:hypothetical protein
MTLKMLDWKIQTDLTSIKTIQYNALGRVLSAVKPNQKMEKKTQSFRRIVGKTNSVHSDGCAVINWIDMKCIALMHQDTQLRRTTTQDQQHTHLQDEKLFFLILPRRFSQN